jgi:hypothetical protein
MSLSFEEVNCLGNLINDTFGKGSTNQIDYKDMRGAPAYGDDSLGGWTKGGVNSDSSVVTKATLQGEDLTLTSIAVVNLGPISHQHQIVQKTEEELNQHINAYMKELKTMFKKKEYAGRALKTKEQKDKRATDVEIINFYAETRQAYIYRRASFEIS